MTLKSVHITPTNNHHAMKALLFTLSFFIMAVLGQAQVESDIESRISKLESQVRELQNKVSNLNSGIGSDLIHTPKTAPTIQEVTQDGLSIKVIEVKKANQSDAAQYEAGEPIKLEILIKNVSDQDIPFIFDTLVNVVDAEGNTIKCFWNLWDNMPHKFIPGIPVKNAFILTLPSKVDCLSLISFEIHGVYSGKFKPFRFTNIPIKWEQE